MMGEEAWRLDELREEARYRRERLSVHGKQNVGSRRSQESPGKSGLQAGGPSVATQP
jgi:hypothetical protein